MANGEMTFPPDLPVIWESGLSDGYLLQTLSRTDQGH